MRRVELVPGIESSVIGFGCAPIMGAVGAHAAKKAIHLALDCGINHFDTAPSYGFGQGEGFLGKELLGIRDEVVVTTKFGIVATPMARVLGPAKPCLRFARSLMRRGHRRKQAQPSLAKSPLGSRFHKRIPFSSDGMRKSVDSSLRRLRTDYIDYLCLHEPFGLDSTQQALVSTAADLKRQGKIRGFGVSAFSYHLDMHEAYLPQFDYLQVNPDMNSRQSERILKERSQLPNVFFSPIKSLCATSPYEIEESMRGLLTEFPRSILLFSMFNKAHILKNASLGN